MYLQKFVPTHATVHSRDRYLQLDQMKILSYITYLLIVLSIVSCKQEVKSEPESEPKPEVVEKIEKKIEIPSNVDSEFKTFFKFFNKLFIFFNLADQIGVFLNFSFIFSPLIY